MVRPIGLFALMAALGSVGVSAEVIDLHRFQLSNAELVERVRPKEFRVFGITCSTYTRFSAIAIAHLLKEHFPGRPIVVGGPHFSACAHDALTHLPCVDVVVRGEGDTVAKELIPAMIDGRDLSGIAGISYRDGTEIRHNPDAAVIRDLDSLPFLTDFSREDYPEVVAMCRDNGRRVPAVGISTSRGCPNRCLFCSVGRTPYRSKSAEAVVDEMEAWMDRFPEVRGFNIFDLTFTADQQRLRAICEEIINRNLDIRWWAESRVDINLDLPGLMYAAGCRALSVGVESGSPRVLRRIDKGITLDLVHDFIATCDDVGIWVDPFIMFSHPSETIEDLRMTMRLVKDLLKRHNRVFYPGGGPVVTAIRPGSRLERIARANGVIPEDFSWNLPYYDPRNLDLRESPYVPIYLEHLSREDIEAALRKTNYWIAVKYQGRFKRWRETVSRVIAPDRSMREKARIALQRARAWIRFRV